MSTNRINNTGHARKSVAHLLYATHQNFNIQQHQRPMHSHEALCEIHFCYQGSGYYTIKGIRQEVQAGDLLFANKNEEHELLASSRMDYCGYCLGYSGSLFEDLPENCLVPEDAPRVCNAGKQYALLLALAEQIMDQHLNSSLEQQLIESLAQSFLLLARAAVKEPRSMTPSIKTNQAATQVKSYIAAHYLENLSLNSIAYALSFSTSYLTHTFKKATGYSVMEYVIRRRIGYAETLLISSDFSVTDIAIMCGYDNISHFQTTFKRIAGITPLQFRKRYLSEMRGERDQR